MKSQQVRLLLIIGVIAVGTAVLSLAYCHDHTVAPLGAFDSTSTAESPGAVSDRVARPSADAVADSSSERREANVHLGDTQAEHSPEIDVAAGAREVVVLVIDGETNLPVPSVDVAYTDWFGAWSEWSSDDTRRWQSFGTDCFAQYRAFGSVARTDMEGRVRLPLKTSLDLACTDDGRAGEVHIKAREFDWSREQLLVLRPDFSLRVRVVDQTGEPVVGMPVGMQPDGSLGFAVGHTNVVTGAGGIAELRNMRSWVRARAEFFTDEQPPTTVNLRLAVRGLDPDTSQVHHLSLAKPPEGIIEFVAPPTGEIVVAMRDSWGQPCGKYNNVSLNKDPGAYAVAGETMGVAKFAWIALGQRFEATASFAPVRLKPVQFDGPVAPGQVIHVVMQEEDTGGALLTGLLVDENHDPVEGEVTLHYQTESCRGPTALETGTDGRFRFQVKADMVGQRFHHAILLNKDKGLVCELPFDQPIRRARHDLGRLVMTPMPLLVAGEVRIDQQPARADLRIEHLPAGAPDDSWQRYRGAHLHVVEWPEPGKFHIRAAAVPGRYRLLASKRDALPLKPVAIEVGQRFVEIDLVTGGSMRAVVLVDEDALLEELTCILTPHRATPDQVGALRSRGRTPAGRLTNARQGAPRNFLWHGIARGSYRLEVRCAGQASPLAMLDELIVEAGGYCDDPRLESIDLRGKLQRIKLTLLDEQSGQPISASTTLFSGDAAQLVGIRKYHRNAAIDVVGRVPMSFSINARGFEVAHVKAVREDCSVRLRRLSQLKIVLPTVELPPGTRFKFVAARQLDERTEQQVWINTSFGPREFSIPDMLKSKGFFWDGQARTIEVPARAGGSVVLSFWLRGLWGRSVFPALGTTHENRPHFTSQVVCDPSEPTPVKVRISPEALRAALAELGR